MENPEISQKEVLLDSCWILQACSTIGDKQRPPDGYSQIDQEVRDLGLNPKEMRKEMLNLLANNQICMPEGIIKELKEFLLNSCTKLNSKNKSRLSDFLLKLKGKVIEMSYGINEYNLQKEVFSLIESESNKRIKNLEKKFTNPPLKEIYKDPVCKTWKKICHFKESVLKAAQGIKNHKPFLLNDFEIILTAKKRKALIKTYDGDIKVLLAAYNQILKEKCINIPNTPHESNIT